MTLDEKIGQLTMGNRGGVFHSNNPSDDDLLDDLRAGRLGSLIGIYGEDATTRLQRIAIEETRLRIPLIFGVRCDARLPLDLPGAARRGGGVRSGSVGAHRANGGLRDARRRRDADVCADDRCHARSALGTHRRNAGRRSVARRAVRARPRCRGFQGSDIGRPDAIAATVKHIGAYGAVTAGRDYASVDVSERQLNEVYLPPFRAAAEAGVAAIMPSFNDLAGIPTTANAALLRDRVRGGWGFDGVIVSDFNAVLS